MGNSEAKPEIRLRVPKNELPPPIHGPRRREIQVPEYEPDIPRLLIGFGVLGVLVAGGIWMFGSLYNHFSQLNQTASATNPAVSLTKSIPEVFGQFFPLLILLLFLAIFIRVRLS